MPFERPTLKQLDDRIRNDIAGRMQIQNSSNTASLFRRSVVAVLSRVYAGVCHLLYAFLYKLSLQRFVHSMEGEFLDAEGLMYDLPRKQAEYAIGIARITGTEGHYVPEETIYQRDDGAQYRVAGSSEIIDGTGSVAIEALVSGGAGNAQAGTILRLVTPITGIQREAVVGEDGIRYGVDTESDEDYRERILARKREPPHGGARHDYVQWALQVPGVTRAWCLPLWMGLGTVGVMFVRDNDDDIIPTEEQCQTVYNYIEPLRPVTAELFVFPPVRLEVDVTVQISPDVVFFMAAVAALGGDVPALSADMFEDVPAAAVAALNAVHEQQAHWFWSFLGTDAASNLLNYILTGIVTIIVGLFKWKGTRKEKALLFIQAGIRHTHETYTRAIKKGREDGKLTEAERQEANRLACQYALNYAKHEGFNILKVYAKEALPAVVDGVLRKIQGEAAMKRLPLSPPPSFASAPLPPSAQ